MQKKSDDNPSKRIRKPVSAFASRKKTDEASSDSKPQPRAKEKKKFDKPFKSNDKPSSSKKKDGNYFADKFGNKKKTGGFSENAYSKGPKKKFSADEKPAYKKFPKPESSTDFKEKNFKSKKTFAADDDNIIYTESNEQADEVRLNKYIAHAGIASRRGADELIKAGRVTVNGTVVTEMGYKVKLKDDVGFDGKSLSLERKYYILLNKPKDFITTVSDERDRKTVMDLIRSAYAQIKGIKRPRLYPVGRLDRNTTGVLLITNDGELAQKLTHPSSEIRKVYHVMLDKKLMKEDFDKIAEGGVVLEDGIAEVDVIAYPNPKNKSEIGLEIHTGKNRFVRRVFESLGYEVVKLDRVAFAGLTKKDLPRGRWRFLKEDEVRLLKHFQK